MKSLIRRVLPVRPADRKPLASYRRFQLMLDTLEDRTTPATFTVLNTAGDASADSLRDCVTKANNNAGPDTIVFGAGVSGQINLTGSEIAVTGTDPIDIIGPGATGTGSVLVNGGSVFRIFNNTGSGALSVSKLTLAFGRSAASTGGAINALSGPVTITDAVIRDSQATTGGAIRTSSGAITLVRSSLTGNVATGSGGAIYTVSGNVTLTDSTVSGNTAAGNGGGIRVQNPGTTSAFTNSTLSGNKATGGSGGAVYFFSGSNLTVSGSTISGNSCTGTGGGIYQWGTALTTVINSTFSGNSAGNGGAITLNTAGSSLDARNSTFANNTATGSGGGVNGTGGVIALTSTLFGGNTAPTGPDISSAATSANNSLIQNTAGAGTITGANNKLNVNPLINPLGNNGGPTQTHTFAAASPLINAGSNPFALTTDQRGTGFARVVGSAADIGAVEFDLPPSANIPAGQPLVDITTGGAVTYPFGVQYKDDLAINTATVINNNAAVRITGPGGFNVLGTYVSIDNVANGQPRTGQYKFTPPGGSWDFADNGTYTVSVEANQVKDSATQSVPAGTLGTFTVTVPGPIPTAKVTFSPTVTAAGGSTYTFTVLYGDDIAINTATVINNNLAIQVVGPNGLFLTTTPAQFLSIDNAAVGTPRTATYIMTPPGGAWDEQDNGKYVINILANQVFDTNATPNPVPAGQIGTFTVATPSTPPTAVISPAASDVQVGGGTVYTFGVQYTDNVGINTSTIDSTDVRVTGPGGFNVLATFVSVSGPVNGSPQTANYKFTPPGGAWDVTDNGGYTISMEPNQVTDTFNAPVAAGTLDTFIVGVGKTFTVTNTNDSGAGSLRQAIIDANTFTPSLDFIVFDTAAGKAFDPAKGPQVIQLTGGQIPITDSLTITGTGNDKLAVRASKTASNTNRILNIDGTNLFGTQLNVTLNDIRLDEGNVSKTKATQATASGGAILINDEIVTLNRAIVTDNRVVGGSGGAIAVVGANGQIILNDSKVSGNTATSNAQGGGYGGGISIDGFNGLLQATRTEIGFNAAVQPVGVTAGGNGGGIAANAEAVLFLVESLVTGNTATKFGGGILQLGTNAAVFNISYGTTVANNTAQGGGGVAFSGTAAAFIVSNSTFTGNSATGTPTSGNLVIGNGGAILLTNFAGAADLRNSTFTLNSTTGNEGGAINRAAGFGDVNVYSSVIAQNIHKNLNPLSPDIYVNNATINSDFGFIGDIGQINTVFGSNNQFGDAALLTSVNGVNNTSSPTAIDAKLQGVAFNGGPTPTHRPGPGSPLLDRGDNAIDNLAFDQRGVLFDRVFGTAPDIGSYEFQPADILSVVTSQPSPTTADNILYTVTFDQPVAGLTAANFRIETLSGNATADLGTPVTADGFVFSVPLLNVRGDGTLRLVVIDNDAVAANGTGTDPTIRVVPFNGNIVTIDNTSPTVTFTLLSPNPTNLNQVSWKLNFTENIIGSNQVVGLDFSNLSLTQTGTLFGAAFVSITKNNPAEYIVVASTQFGDGNLTLNLANSTDLADAVGNPVVTPASAAPYTIDRTRPTPQSIVRNVGFPTPTNKGQVEFLVTFSEPVGGLTAANFATPFTGLGGTVNVASVVANGTGQTWTVTVNTGTGDGTVGLTLLSPSTSVADPATNKLFLAANLVGPTFTVDRTLPFVQTITRLDPDPTNGATSVRFQVTFSEPVTPPPLSAFSAVGSGGVTANVTSVTGSGTTYTVTVSNIYNIGTLRLDLINTTGIQDPATNGLAGTFNAGQVYNVVANGIVTGVTQLDPVASNLSLVRYRVTFNQDVTGLSPSNFTLATTGTLGGAVVTNVTGSGGDYVVEVDTGTGTGDLTLTFDNSTGVSPAIVNVPLAGPTYTIDRTDPTVTSITPVAPATTNAGSVAFTVVFSEPVLNVGIGTFAVQATGLTGTVAVTNVTGSGTTYTVTVGTGTGDGTIALGVPDLGTITDAVGNDFAGPFGFGPQVFTIDRTAPQPSSITRTGPSLTNAGTVTFTVVFTEPVFNLSATNFVAVAGGGVTGATVANLSGSGTTYTVTVNTGSGNGTVGLRLNTAGATTDLATNPLVGVPFDSTGAYTIDKVRPTLTNATLLNSSPTNQSTVAFRLTFSEAVVGFSPASLVIVPNGTLATTSVVSVVADPGDPLSYIVTVNTGTGDGTLQLAFAPVNGVADPATNDLVVSAIAPTYTVDRTAPLANITTTDPTPTRANSVTYSVVFDEPVTGLTTADFGLTTGGTIAGASVTNVTGSGTTYTVTVNTGTGDGSIALVLSPVAAIDAAGNPPATVTGPAFTLDRTRPTSAITLLTPATTNASTASFQVVFSEPVLGVTAAQFALAAAGLPGAAVVSVTGTGATYTVNILTGNGTGTINLVFTPTTTTDAVGNQAVGSTSPTLSVDRTPPVATITRVGAGLTNAGTVTYTVTFSEPVLGVTDANFVSVATVLGASVASVTESNGVFTVVVNTGTGTGTVGLNFLPDGVTDPAGNAPGAVTGPEFTVDRTLPTALLTTFASNPLVSLIVPVTVTFSEPVTGFTLADVTVTNGTATNLVALSPTQYTFDVTATAAGDVVVRVVAGAVTDAAGNPNPAPNPLTRTYPAITPIVTQTGVPTVANGPVTVTVNTSQGISGFTQSDLVVTNGTVTNFTATPAKSTFQTSFTFTVTPGKDGPVSVTVPASAGVNVVNLGNDASTSTFIFDTGAAKSTVSLASGQSATAANFNDTIRFAVKFSEAVTGFTAAGVVVGGTSTGTAVVSVTGSGTDYEVAVSGRTGPGTVTLTTAAGSSTDAAGNPSVAAGNTATVTLPDPPPPLGLDRFAVAAGAGGASRVQVFNSRGELNGAAVVPFGAQFTGGARVATADFNGDGFVDVVVGTGPGRSSFVQVLDGRTQELLFSFSPFEEAFTGGIYVAAGDLNGDGKPELVVTPDEGGGPRVIVRNGTDFGLMADFFGIEDVNFRGGARAAIGDVTGDKVGDLVVAAGFGGGPRVAGYTGQSIVAGKPVRAFGDFFAFEQTLRNGVFVAAGDLNGDGVAEVVVGGGPGGGPRVVAFDGANLTAGTQSIVANFFAGNPNNRGGVPVAVKDLDADTKLDIVVGTGQGDGSHVTAYLGKNIRPTGTPAALLDFDAFPGFAGGVFVG